MCMYMQVFVQYEHVVYELIILGFDTFTDRRFNEEAIVVKVNTKYILGQIYPRTMGSASLLNQAQTVVNGHFGIQTREVSFTKT